MSDQWKTMAETLFEALDAANHMLTEGCTNDLSFDKITQALADYRKKASCVTVEPQTDTMPDAPNEEMRYLRNYAAYLMSGIESDQPMPCPEITAISDERAVSIRQALVSLPQYAIIRLAQMDSSNCSVCGFIHKPCTMCGARTECSTEEIGEQYSTCHQCDLQLAGKDS